MQIGNYLPSVTEGYVTFNNGTLVQWGYFEKFGTSDQGYGRDIEFPKPFSKAFFFCNQFIISASNTSNAYTYLTTDTRHSSGVALANDKASISTNYKFDGYWFAIGKA